MTIRGSPERPCDAWVASAAPAERRGILLGTTPKMSRLDVRRSAWICGARRTTMNDREKEVRGIAYDLWEAGSVIISTARSLLGSILPGRKED
jgi:hypothetical protein